VLRLVGVTQVFGDGDGTQQVLDDITLSVSPGEYLGIRGRSGCGKSTLLNVMSLLLQPSKGAVEFDGVTVPKSDDKRLRLRGEHMGLIFQNANLISCLNPLENILLGMRGAEKQRRRKDRAMELLEGVGLGRKATAKVRSLSGGEAQRVAICRAIANRPRFLFCDEPTGALDDDNSRTVMKTLEALRLDTGCALVVVTHENSLWESAERRITIQGGRVDENE
jgi:ABC-type lipoprotein export system ATPase subunit